MSISNKIRGLKEIWAFDNRLWLAVSRVLFPSEKLQVYRYHGFDILTDHAGGDANGAREVLTSPMYRRYLAEMKFDGPLNVLDLGANNGGFPLLLAASGLELKKVVSVEFNPNTFMRLQFNLLRNLTGEVFPLNAALCGESREIEVSPGAGSVSDSIYDEKNNGRPAVAINGMTLDELCARYFADETIDICKIDVEGAEFEVFLQPSHLRLSQCRYVIIEIHERDARTAGEIVPIIEGLGFQRREPDADADPSVHFFVNNSVAITPA